MKREVKPELLDTLPPDDPRAVRSRRDLRRLNGLMCHASIFDAALHSELGQTPRRIVELGAGDGSLLLELAKRNHARWPGIHITLVDKQNIVAETTLADFHELGWSAEVATADVFDWLAGASAADVILANLFLHHFHDSRLAELFRLIAARTNLFVACETRREWPSFAVARLLGLFGCNGVTRHDACLSMDAGFVNRELSALWSARGWKCIEQRAAVFTHLFVAQQAD